MYIGGPVRDYKCLIFKLKYLACNRRLCQDLEEFVYIKANQSRFFLFTGQGFGAKRGV